MARAPVHREALTADGRWHQVDLFGARSGERKAPDTAPAVAGRLGAGHRGPAAIWHGKLRSPARRGMGEAIPSVVAGSGEAVKPGPRDPFHAAILGHREFLSNVPPAECSGQAKLKIEAEPEGTGSE
ncbi:hypothetical protein SDC9_28794 [bioreactor metagenome]|uniref:Uncharacterized protein n=1 Tax=bioreactor metagenome TaxID=1076179 RepID=A0A644UVR4_9ZZZZ